MKKVEEDKAQGQMGYAWRTAERGKALKWFLQRLEDTAVRAALTRA